MIPIAREIIPIVDRAQWLSARSRDVTASSVGWLFGEGGTPQRLAKQLREGAESRANRLRVIDAHAVRAGRILEPAVAAAVSEAHSDWRLEKATTYYRLTKFRLGATPDYWLGGDGVVECKTCAQSVFDRWGGLPPLPYLLQVLTQLICTDRRLGYIAMLIRVPRYPLYLYKIERHPAAERRLLDVVARFWRVFDAGKAHYADDSGGLAKLLAPIAVAEPRRSSPRVDISRMESPF